MISIESEERPWGQFFVIHDEPNYKLKRIEVEPGERLSYQYHNKRSEVWTIVEGVGTITIGGKVKDYEVGKTILIPKGVKHRIENKGNERGERGSGIHCCPPPLSSPLFFNRFLSMLILAGLQLSIWDLFWSNDGGSVTKFGS